MYLHDIAWESVKRRKARFAFVLAAVVLGIGTVVALAALTRTMQVEVGDELDKFGANIVVTPKSDVLDLAYGSLALGGLAVTREELTLDDAVKIRSIPNHHNVSAVAPKLLGVTTVGKTRVILIGTRFAQEPGRQWWQISGALPQVRGQVLLGADAATALGASVGSTLSIAGQDVRVTGTLAPTGSSDDRAIFCDLELAQQALGRPNGVSLIEVSALCRGCPIEDIVAQIGAALPHAKVTPIRQAVAARERAVRQLTRFSYAVSALLLLVGTLVVMTTMMSSVSERTQEIGILRAVGFRRTHVATIVLLETVVVTSLGGVLGWAAGLLAAKTFGPMLAQVTSPVIVDTRLAVVAVVSAVLIGIAGGAYPAARAAQMDPALALRQI